MSYSKFLLLSVLSASITACSESPSQQSSSDLGAADQQPVAASSLSNGYKKPGAPIRFSSDYSGNTTPGQSQQVKLSFTALADGVMTISIQNKDNILAGGPIEQSQAVKSGTAMMVPVEIVATDSGKYYLNIQSRLSSNGKEQSRAFALPVYVGDWKSVEERSNKTQAAEGNVIIMEAKETSTK